MIFNDVEKYIITYIYRYFHYDDEYFNRDSIPRIMASEIPTGKFKSDEIIESCFELSKNRILFTENIFMKRIDGDIENVIIEGFHSLNQEYIIRLCKTLLD